MNDEIQWGPWIDHDGHGCPLPIGTVVRVELRCGSIHVYRVEYPGCTTKPGWRNAWCQCQCMLGLAPEMLVRRYQLRSLTSLFPDVRETEAPVGAPPVEEEAA